MALHYALLEEGDGGAEARGVRAAAEKAKLEKRADKQVVFKYSSKGSKVQ